jgi:glycerophosphoryl diester phosphodiesterase
VSDLSLQQVVQLDACARWRPRFDACSVPTLREALALVRGRGRIILHLYGTFDRTALVMLAETIQGAGMLANTVVISWDLPVLRDVRSIDPHLAVGWLTSGLPRIDGLGSLGQAVVIPDQRALLAVPTLAHQLLNDARARGVDLATFTVQSQEHAEELVRLGVRNLISDVPLDHGRLAAARR